MLDVWTKGDTLQSLILTVFHILHPWQAHTTNSVLLFLSSLSICQFLFHLSPVFCGLFIHPSTIHWLSVSLCLSVALSLVTVQPEDCCLLISSLFPPYSCQPSVLANHRAPRPLQTPSRIMYINKEAAYWCSLVIGNEAVDKQACLPQAVIWILWTE